MFVNKLAFLVTTSHHIKFGMIELLTNPQEDTVGKSVLNVMSLYGSCGFLVYMVHADGEFKALHGQLATAGSGLNVCSNGEHVPKVEQYIRTVKEHVRCLYNSVPFQHFPALLIRELVMACVFWLNMFPPTNDISNTLNPCTLMMGIDLDYHKHCRLEFGTYVQTHEEYDNSMNSQTTRAIALHPTGNQQGGYYFMSLTMGCNLMWNHWTKLPMIGSTLCVGAAMPLPISLLHGAMAHQSLILTIQLMTMMTLTMSIPNTAMTWTMTMTLMSSMQRNTGRW
jgi:hypothetical protein